MSASPPAGIEFVLSPAFIPIQEKAGLSASLALFFGFMDNKEPTDFYRIAFYCGLLAVGWVFQVSSLRHFSG